jgi:predicted ATP-grasp superfamily ATP-dependent carboligase
LGKRIFIFEYVSGGGLSKEKIPNSLFCEAFGMLISLIKDFTSLDLEVSTLLDRRITHLTTILPRCRSIIVKKEDNFLNKFELVVKDSDYILIVAPESGNVLYKLTKVVKDYNKILLSTNLAGIKIGSSKINTYNFFRNNELLTPKTYLIPLRNNFLDLDFVLKKLDELENPIIIKPEDGVGAESIFLFRTKKQIKLFFQNHYSKIDKNRKYILQEYIEGDDLSISLINMTKSLNFGSKNPLLLSINSQYISIKNLKIDSIYQGGYTPVQNYQAILQELTELLENVDFTAFIGYFGIDLIKTKDSKFYFIEINPRITTSYVGLRNIINENPSRLIIKSQIRESKPSNVTIQYTSIFKKLDLNFGKSTLKPKLTSDILNDLFKLIPELVTPPISFNESNQFTCFIATKTKDLPSSEKRVQEISQILHKKVSNWLNKG